MGFWTYWLLSSRVSPHPNDSIIASSISVVQIFCAHCVDLLSNQCIIVPGFIGFGALFQLVWAFIQRIHFKQHFVFSEIISSKNNNRETYPQAISPEVVPSEWEKEADKSHYAKTKSLPNSNPVQKKISLTELRAKSVNTKAARALPDPKTLKIDVVERPATKPNTPASKKPINSYFVPQGRTTTIASSSLLDYPKESDRQSTSEPGEPGSESHLEIITEATGASAQSH
ncbi:hypothetical protein PSTT_15722 [Puccinia striiformis]|uniref:Uncharacterized protein n=1 Tax=Puccinia striiformis TaxID=27350 RepID=A0A2S4UG94_9BASI|nr:hypothetical protein PSTT_15722 [Puccinia striiformis]